MMSGVMVSEGSSERPVPHTGRTITIAVLTHNREELLRKCVENVLLRTSPATREIIIWNNASTDGTEAYLDSLGDPRFRVVHHLTNIGQNGYARAFSMTSSEHLIEVDDDVVEAPPAWDAMLSDAFDKLPGIGFLAADLEDDPHDVASQYRHHIRATEYTPVTVNGIAILRGPTGGGCAITSRELYDRVGGFEQRKNEVFFLEDAAYVKQINALGYEAAVLADLRVHHTGGPYYSASSKEKDAYWARWNRARARNAVLKRILLRLPFVERFSARLR
jgi:GT2 family glycosyltransferase